MSTIKRCTAKDGFMFALTVTSLSRNIEIQSTNCYKREELNNKAKKIMVIKIIII